MGEKETEGGEVQWPVGQQEPGGNLLRTKITVSMTSQTGPL